MAEQMKIVKLSALSEEQKMKVAVLESKFLRERVFRSAPPKSLLARQRESEYFVAVSGGEPIGFVAGKFSPRKTFDIFRIFVSRGERRKGLSKRLIARCISFARQERATVVLNLPNQAALDSYSSVGRNYYERYASRRRGRRMKLSFDSAEPKVSFAKRAKIK